AGRGHVQSGVFGRGVAVVERHRGVVRAGDGDGHGGDARVGQTVIGPVGEAVGAVVVGGRRVGKATVAVQLESAVRGLADQHRARSTTVPFAAVCRSAGRGYVQGGVFGRGVAVVNGHRRVVHAGDGDGHGGDAGVGQAVVGLIGKGVVAV